MPKSNIAGKVWSYDVLFHLNEAAALTRVLDIGPGEGTYSVFRRPGQYWIGVEAWAPYIETFKLAEKYDQIVVSDIRFLDLDALTPLDLAICGDVLEHMSKDDALKLLDKLLDRARVVVASIPIVHSQQCDWGGNPFETHVKDDWTHAECLASLPDICLAREESPLGIYILSRSEPDCMLLREIDRRLQLTSPAAKPAAYIVAAQNDVKTINNYCYTRARECPGEVIATLEEICFGGRLGLAQRTAVFGLLAYYKEGIERRRLTASPNNATSLEDWRPRFVNDAIGVWHELAKQWLALKPNSYAAKLMAAQAVLAGQGARAAEPYYAQLRMVDGEIQHLASITRFDAAFHGTLEDVARRFVQEAPAVAAVKEGPAVDRILFTACDVSYMQAYGWSMVGSLARFPASNIGLHIHLFDATDDEAEAAKNRAAKLGVGGISISREWTGLRKHGSAEVTEEMRCYYHVARYFRFWQLLESRPGAAAWLLDTDFLFNRSPEPLFDHLAGKDVALWLLPGRTEAHNQIAAGLVGVAPTPAARTYLRRVAGYLAEYIRARAILWGADQTALFAVLAEQLSRNAAPTIAPVTAQLYDGEFGETTVLWPGKCTEDHSAYARYRELVLLSAPP